MSVKSKKTTADKTVRNEKEIRQISHSATKMVNRLSLSFYGEDTLKMQKQVILDSYDNRESDSPISKNTNKPRSYSKNNVNKPKTPVIKFIRNQEKTEIHQKAHRTIKQNQSIGDRKKSKERSSSKSSGGRRSNNPFLNYISNRIDITAKGWTALRPLMRDKTTTYKKL